MSTFMAVAAVDLSRAADPAGFVDALKLPQEPVPYWIRPQGSAHTRVSLYADRGNTWLAEAIADAPDWERAIIALDHDEYGGEHLILSRVDGVVSRVQHVFLHWDGEPGPDFDEVALPRLLPAPTADGMLNTPASWAAVAALYGADPAAVERAGRAAAEAHEELGTIFTPFEGFWDAVGAEYPLELDGEIDGIIVP
ncbi:hypothetical protein ABT369_02135 [Dactylosporangium sp. NPDC000244]|uniref:hypothetical protein n=1 Tax=Dactylosporangium sp. NPDC000244 TaxID=3154365 RepID=UPI00331880C1